MVMFGLNTTEIQNGYDNASMNPYVPERDSTPSWYEGAGTAAGLGFKKSAAELYLAAISTPGESEQDTPVMEGLKQDAITEIASLSPDPKTTGWLGQALHGLTTIVPQATLGFLMGGPVGAAGVTGVTQGFSHKQQLIREGVDPLTAGVASIPTALSNEAGVLMPGAVGGGLLTRTTSGAAINALMGMTERGATGKILEANGYQEMADQYRVLDKMGIFTDMLLGGVFGTMHEGRVEKLPSEVDAALATNNIHHLEIDSAPGIPADIATRNAHIEAMDTALAQAARGENIHVDLPEANFLAKEPRPEAREMAEAFDEHAQDIMTPEQAREVFTPKPIENPYADISAKVERMDPEMQSARLESLNRKMEAAIITPKEMYEREALSAVNAPKVKAEDPLATASKQIAMAKPEMKVMTEDGPVTAMEAVVRAEKEKAQVEKEASVFDAAINCFLRFQ